MNNLIIPVYLNQKLVFDLLAMLQDGISTVKTISENNSGSSTINASASGSFGLHKAISSLFSIDFSGNIDGKENSTSQKSVSTERLHTPASLFYELRNILKSKNVLKKIDSQKPPVAGDFIEFEGYLTRNPIIETLDTLLEIMSIGQAFSNNKENKQHSKTIQQIKGLNDKVKAGNTVDLISVVNNTKNSIVLTAEIDFLNDPLMADLVDGKFKVLGKVIKNVKDDSSSINLLRKTVLSKMPKEILYDVLHQFDQMEADGGFQIPEAKHEVHGPALHILPIAIFS